MSLNDKEKSAKKYLQKLFLWACENKILIKKIYQIKGIQNNENLICRILTYLEGINLENTNEKNNSLKKKQSIFWTDFDLQFPLAKKFFHNTLAGLKDVLSDELI